MSYAETFYASLKNHSITGQGISGFSLVVVLHKSENKYIAYPAVGVLRVLEQGTDLSIIKAVFHLLAGDGKLGPPVVVKRPSFSHH